MSHSLHDGSAFDVGVDDALDLYRVMLLIRRFDELALDLRLEGRAHGTVHPYIGQEAVAAGVCQVLHTLDFVVSNHRGHGHCIAKGVPVKEMMAELFGRVGGSCKGRGGSMHIADFRVGVIGANGIVGAGLPIGVGAAFAVREAGWDSVVVCFFGEGATGQGVFHEALNLSALWGLPVVFVCENNGISSNTPIEIGLPQHDIVKFALPYGIEGRSADGADVFSVLAAARSCVDATRETKRPTLLECKTYRWQVHNQRGVRAPDTRSEEEVAEARSHDSIESLAETLREWGVADEQLAAVAASVEEELTDAVDFAERSPFPDPSDALEGVFA